MQVFLLHVSCHESGSNQLLWSTTRVYATKELAEEVVSLSPSWDASCNEAIDYTIIEQPVHENIDRPTLIKLKEESDALFNGSNDELNDYDYNNYNHDHISSVFDLDDIEHCKLCNALYSPSLGPHTCPRD